jgi:hypothetical protein
MKKIAALFVLLVCLLALSVSSSEQAMRVITKQRYAGTGLFHSDKYTFGDLYGLSYLPEFRLPKSEGFIQPPTGLPAEKDIDLYIVGDSYLYSYLEPIPANYARVARVDFRRWAHVPVRAETFQSPRKKVLLIESVERNLANVLGLGHVRAVFEPTPPVDKPWWEQWNEAIKAALYHPTLESNLDFTLFNVSLLSPLKGWKATWNDRVFGRPAAEVVRSSQGDRLFMKETVGPQEMGSSFREISDAEIQRRVHEMEEIQTFYRAKGFDQVLFSFMPNPVALLDAQRGKGNQLLARIQAASAGPLTIIDPTDRLKSNAEAYFYRSDSHWNQRGARVWLDQLNEVLRGTAR